MLQMVQLQDGGEQPNPHYDDKGDKMCYITEISMLIQYHNRASLCKENIKFVRVYEYFEFQIMTNKMLR